MGHIRLTEFPPEEKTFNFFILQNRKAKEGKNILKVLFEDFLKFPMFRRWYSKKIDYRRHKQ